MARRKPNVSARTRPSEALRNAPAPASGGVVEPEEDPVAENGLPDADGGTADEQPGAADPPPEPVLGEMMSDRILNKVFQTPVIPDGLMSDEPFPGQTPDEGDRAIAPQERLPETRGTVAGPGYAPVAAPAYPEILQADPDQRGSDRDGRLPDRHGHPGAGEHGVLVAPQKYVQRVTVTEAYQFTGRVQAAPPWIDRNWLSFDEASKDETGVGIVLEVPGTGICRIGDYIVQQKVMMDQQGYSMDRIAVYSRDDFEKMFLPVVS